MHEIRNYLGQISPGELAAAVEGVDAAESVIVISMKRPSTNHERASVATYFGHDRWRQGMWRIVAKADVPKTFAASTLFGTMALPEFLKMVETRALHASKPTAAS